MVYCIKIIMKTLILDTTTKSIMVRMSGAATTLNPDFTASWADNTGAVFTEGNTNGVLAGTTNVTMVASPTTSVRRIIKSITVQNTDSAPVTITVIYDDNTVQRQIAVVTLAVNDVWTLDGTYDSTGAIKSASTGGSTTVPIQEEGTTVTASPTAINFVGAGVTATDTAGVATVTIPGGGTAVPIQEEGTTVTAAPTAINFVGAGATVTDTAGVATVTIPGGGSSGGMTLLKSGTGSSPFTDGTISVDSVAITGLLVNDYLKIFYQAVNGTDGPCSLVLYSATGSSSILNLNANTNLAVNGFYRGEIFVSPAIGSNFFYDSTSVESNNMSTGNTGVIYSARNPATDYTAPWTLALRISHDPFVTTGAVDWRWSVYKLSSV